MDDYVAGVVGSQMILAHDPRLGCPHTWPYSGSGRFSNDLGS